MSCDWDGQLLTDRLLLRRWRYDDREPFAAMNADPQVMEYLPKPLSRAESDALVEAIEAGFDRHGFGLWALETRRDGELIGFTGLSVPAFEAHFTPAVEVGWRLARWHWGHGYATEGATAALDLAFGEKGGPGLTEVVSSTTAANLRSQAVMRGLGMRRDPADDFDHPRLPEGDPLRPHVLYRIDATQWRSRPRP